MSIPRTRSKSIVRRALTNVLSFFVLIVVCSLGFANTDQNSLLDARIRLFEAWLESAMNEQAIPSVSVSLVQNQRLVYTRGFGFADVQMQRPASADTQYRIASVTKLFTSIALMQLIENQQLTLQTPIVDIVPELAAIQSNGYAIEDMTVWSILTHTTGLPTHANVLLDRQAPLTPPVRHAFLEGFEEQSLLFPPNRIHKYSNLSMNIAGVIIERVSNLRYEEYIQKFILTPLQMDATRFPSSSSSAVVESQAIGYDRLIAGQRSPAEFSNMASLLGHPAAGLLSSTRDLARFLSWHFRTLSNEDSLVLTAQTLEQMQQVQWVPLPLEQGPLMSSVTAFLSNSLNLGGTGLGYFRNQELVLHGGGLRGFASEVVMDNQNQLGIAVLSNSLDAPVNFSYPRSISKTLYEVVGLMAADADNANLSLAHPEYEGVYTDNGHRHYYVTEIEQSLVMINLREASMFDNPAVLTRVAKDRFTDEDHQGFYAGEFTVEFYRDETGTVDGIYVNREKLYRE